MKRKFLRLITLSMVVAVLLLPFTAFAAVPAFIGPFNTISLVSTTVPANGDVNPYGVAVVPTTMGTLVKGNILVSNFNNMLPDNQQGRGTTIVQITPAGVQTLFAQIDAASLPGPCPGGVGLTTALVALRTGWVIVGSLPTADGTAATAQAGCLLVLDSSGNVVKTITSMINGPWDMTAVEGPIPNVANLFVSNVLNGTVAASPNVVNKGYILRITISDRVGVVPAVMKSRIIGSGFSQRTDPAALVIGVTGLGFGPDGKLYIADTLNNRIAAIPGARSRNSSMGPGKTVTFGGSLNQPLGLAIAPNRNILVVNAGDGNMVEVTPLGKQVAVKNVDETLTGGGTLFGLAIAPQGAGVYLVNDGDNELDFFHAP